MEDDAFLQRLRQAERGLPPPPRFARLGRQKSRQVGIGGRDERRRFSFRRMADLTSRRPLRSRRRLYRGRDNKRAEKGTVLEGEDYWGPSERTADETLKSEGPISSISSWTTIRPNPLFRFPKVTEAPTMCSNT